MCLPGGAAPGPPPERDGRGTLMAPTAAYDEIADWYETRFLAAQADGDPRGIHRAIETLLGAGTGRCLEIGCGTGVYAAPIRAHLPLPALLHAILDAGLTLDRFIEGGAPTPVVLGVRAVRR
jgi:hypothetical protein